MNKMKVTLIHNPEAGGDKPPTAADILGLFAAPAIPCAINL